MNADSYIWISGGLLVGGLGIWLGLRLGHKSPTVRNGPDSRTAIADSLKKVEGASAGADALILGDIEHPLLEITPTEFSGRSADPIAVDSSMRSALQPLLQRAPEFFRFGREMTTKTYRLVFSPTVTRALNKGTLELVPSAGELLPVVRKVGGSKKFLKLGRVVTTGGIRLANVAAASWQIASIATAQHYLAEINARLAGIERGIDDIRTWLEEEKKGELRAAVHLLREYYHAIARGELHEHERAAIYHQLDDIERTCLSIGELAREMSRRRLEELDRLDVREWMDRGGSAERALKWVKHNREALDLISLAQSVRILVCQVKSTMPGDRLRLHDRIEHAKQEVIEAQRLFEATREVLDAKVQELAKRKGNVFALGGLLDEDYRHKINTEYSCAREHTAQAVEKLRRESASALDFSSRFQALDTAGLALDVRVNEDGKIDILSAKPTSA
jgi:hypothetical protein